MSAISDAIGKQGETESNLDYKLRYSAWKRREKKRKHEMMETPAEEESEDDDSLRGKVKSAWSKSEQALKDMDE